MQDFRIALKNTYNILKVGGIFRCVIPDLEWATRKYLDELETGGSVNFLGKNTLLGTTNRVKGAKQILSFFFGNSSHLWMWDKYSLSIELQNAGFNNIRNCKYGDCNDTMFTLVEDKDRFVNAVAIECKK